MCWAFDLCETEIERLYWTHSYYELSKKVELKYGQMHASHLCQHNALVQVVSMALGGKSKGGAPPPAQGKNMMGSSGNMELDVARINQMLSFG